MKSSARKAPPYAYHLNQDGCFCIENYHQTKPFSNFFPGVAGPWGIPMWVFYVNRGQGVCSFGIESKDKAIVEFQPANKAYRMTATHGFRTFLKVQDGKAQKFWEPFANAGARAAYRTHQTMYITAHDLTIVDENFTLGLKVTVNYFTIPGESFPALARRVRVENTGKKARKIQMIDGLPAINAFGMKDWLSKNMARTVEAWIKVRNLSRGVSFFHLNVEVADTPDVHPIEEGYFHAGFSAGPGKPALLAPIVDPQLVFGQATDFSAPQEFLAGAGFTLPKVQHASNRTPCAFSYFPFSLPARGQREIVQVYGYAHNLEALDAVTAKITAKDYIDEKAQQNKGEIDRIKNFALTRSAAPEFDLYCGQTFLDNVLRGGLPVSLRTEKSPVAFNVYSRKHGDLERDYNYFTLAPTYFSQGNGNFRDVNQNRRNDVWFNADVGDTAIINFLSLVQPDGYNPLVVKGLSFVVENNDNIKSILRDCVKGDFPVLRETMAKGFQPGELLQIVEQEKIPLNVPLPDFLGRVLIAARKHEQADHGEGFWVDHWTYNLDLIESYLGRYPENLKSLLLERREFSFYHNTHYVLPRERRYMLTDKGVRQYKSVYDGIKELEKDRDGHKLRMDNGKGKVYYTTLLAKLICLIVNKAATLDPDGLGIEMEADKPGWYDSLNGLPGLLGSSICETFELRRLALFVRDALAQLELDDDDLVMVYEELATFTEELKEVLKYEEEPLTYWDKSNEVKEFYRSRVVAGIEGREREISIGLIRELLALVIKRTDRALDVRGDDKGVVPTYFYYEVTEHEKLDMDPYVMPVKFKRHTLPLFLEGPVHAMRTLTGPEEVRDLHKAVRRSALFDKKLKMYKVNADISSQPNEIGRSRIFPRGWLENESVWLHMEYKYFLELLKAGLNEEFFEAFEDALIPFLKPETYGRSVLENSSFIVSSAHEDSSLHGQGFVARLSGSTAEFIHMWLLMSAGRRPFVMDGEKLTLALKPALPGWLFSKKASLIEYVDREGLAVEIALPKNTYAFNFLGSTLAVYHNPARKNTYGPQAVRAARVILTSPEYSEPVTIDGPVVSEPYSRAVRDGKVDRIDVHLV